MSVPDVSPNIAAMRYDWRSDQLIVLSTDGVVRFYRLQADRIC
jgi:hypothetical protein